MHDEDETSPDTGSAKPDASGESLTSAVVQRLQGLLAEPLAPGLYLVATPIGNLGDMTLRALAVLAAADVVYCEDTRHSRNLLSAFGIHQRLRSYHEHNAEAERPRILADLDRGARIALISDAGTPLVSDPGYKLVRDALEAGHRAISIPGASTVTAALASCGHPTDRFLFAGFLPAKSGPRRQAIKELAGMDATLVLFEAPQRLAACLADLAEGLGPRPAVVARELTKRFEELMRGPLAELAEQVADQAVRGEIVILVAPAARETAAAISDETIVQRLEAELENASLRDAARLVAEALGVPRNRVYDIGLALRRQRS